MRGAIAALMLLLSFSYSHAGEIANATDAGEIPVEGKDYIKADGIEHAGAVYNATGSVYLKTEDGFLAADYVRYDRASGEVFADGNVHYEDSKQKIKAERALLNLRNDTGVLYGATILIKKDNYRIEGAEVWQTGEDRYYMPRASFTTCDGVSPFWCFTGRNVDVRVGDRLKSRHATMRIKGVPALYTPYIWMPILTDRKTGLLFPSFGFRNKTGYYYRQPFFLVLADNKDATFYVDYYSRLGMGQGAQYRYLYSGIKGDLNIYRGRDNENRRDYYEYRASHRQTGRYVSGHLDLNLVSHKDFYRLYEPYLEQGSKRYTESSAEVYGRAGKARLYFLGRYYIDLKEEVDDKEVLQRIPEAGIYIAPSRIGFFTINAKASASSFTREIGDSGDRLDALLRVSHSAGKGIALLQTVQVRKSLYSFRDEGIRGQAEETMTREVFAYGAYLKGNIHRGFGEKGSIEHAVEPALSYRYAEVSKQKPPFFDSVELLPVKTSSMEASLTNRLLDARSEAAALKISGSYDFLDLEKPVRPLIVDAFAQKGVSLRLGASYDFYEEEITGANSEVGVTVMGVSASVGQNYVTGVGVTLYTFGLGYGGRRLSMGSRLLYDPEEDLEKELSGWFTYNHQCWAFTVSAVRRPPEDYSMFFTIRLAGIGPTKPIFYGPRGFSRTETAQEQ